jgi:hypothetical protein
MKSSTSIGRLAAWLRRVMPVDPPVTRVVPELREYPAKPRPGPDRRRRGNPARAA